MIHNDGVIKWSEADDANIPVDIHLRKLSLEEVVNARKQYRDETVTHVLMADNYMPRKGRLSGEDCYCLYGDLPNLQAVLKQWAILYDNASKNIRQMISSGEGRLYYWSAPE